MGSYKGYLDDIFIVAAIAAHRPLRAATTQSCDHLGALSLEQREEFTEFCAILEPYVPALREGKGLALKMPAKFHDSCLDTLKLISSTGARDVMEVDQDDPEE